MLELITQLITSAIKRRASDIHFEPQASEYQIRFRRDSILYSLQKLPLTLAPRISACLKIMADLDIAEKRLPQDGSFQLVIEQSQFNFRLSTCPVWGGEKIVLRILDPHIFQAELPELGLTAHQLQIFTHQLLQPQGLILVTGPTGSGKTSTLYSALRYLNNGQQNIVSAEDPIEIQVNGLNQTAVNPKIGLSFAQILRCFLRQDPDIILIGEIRDQETAEIAIHAAQTGHLVLASLHTENASCALTRLINLGIPHYNLTALSLIVAQRLIRKLCTKHKTNTACTQCEDGYQGRTGIFEVLNFSLELKQLLLQQEPIAAIQNLAIKQGMLSLWQSGMLKIESGLTTLAELQRVLGYEIK